MYGSTDTRSCAWWHWIAGTGVTHADDVLVAFFGTRRIPFPGITERGGGEGRGGEGLRGRYNISDRPGSCAGAPWCTFVVCVYK